MTSWIIHLKVPSGWVDSEAPTAATGLPQHAGRVEADGELSQSCSQIQGSHPV